MPQSLPSVEKAIRANTYLKLAVLDVTIEDDTLIVAIDHTIPVRFTTRILREVWNGPVEVYSPATMMTGMTEALSG